MTAAEPNTAPLDLAVAAFREAAADFREQIEAVAAERAGYATLVAENAALRQQVAAGERAVEVALRAALITTVPASNGKAGEPA